MISKKRQIEAFKKVIRTLQRSPQRYNFWFGDKPYSTRSRGCILALLGEKLGIATPPKVPTQSYPAKVAHQLGIANEQTFYARIQSIGGSTYLRSGVYAIPTQQLPAILKTYIERYLVS
jgi:hypothetical protein